MKLSIYRDGDLRVRSLFLLSPLKIRGETRWFERVRILERYSDDYYSNKWTPIEFI